MIIILLHTSQKAANHILNTKEMDKPCLFDTSTTDYDYYTHQKHWDRSHLNPTGKTLANQSFQSFGEENIGEFKLLALS